MTFFEFIGLIIILYVIGEIAEALIKFFKGSKE